MFKHLAKDFNFEFYKGGSAPMPPPPDYTAMSNAEIAKQNNQARIDRENAARAELKEKKQHNLDVQKSSERMGSAYNSNISYGRNQLATRGIDNDKYGVMAAYQAELDRVRGGAPEIVSDPSSIFSPTLFDDTYNRIRGTQRGKIGRDADAFMGDGFADTMFADTADDDILSSILGDQYNDALGNIDRAHSRGTINDGGYQMALKELGKQKSAGNARAQDTGLGVLQSYRGQLNNEAKSFRNRIDNWDLADTLDLDGERGKLDGLKSSLSGRMEGDILNAIGGQNYFDTDTILGKAGNASGIQNNSTALGASPTANGVSLTTKDEDKNKNLGSTGEF